MAALSPSFPQSPQTQASAGSPGDPLAELRAATADMHALLDSQLPLSRPQATAAHYRQHIAFIDAWLAAIARLPIPPSDWPPGWHEAQQGRRARIAADLAGQPAPPSGLPETALPCPPPDHAAGFAWGVAYVVEGSQLGGQMLWRRLRESLAPQALHYLQGDGSKGGWPRFTSALRQALAEPAALQSAIAGATWAFDDLSQRFRQAGAIQ